MAFQYEFDFNGGSGMKPAQTSVTVTMDGILAAVGDPEADTGKISRLIALEIANLIRQLTETGPVRRRAWEREIHDRIRACRQLHQTLLAGHSLATRNTLNLDGPKFQFVFAEILKLFRTALRDSAVEDFMAQNVMLQFSDLVKASDDEMRRELNKV